MTKKIIYFRPKVQEQNPKIKEGKLIGIPIQPHHNLIWTNCGYLMVPDNEKAIQFIEKPRNQEHYFKLEAEIRETEFMEDVISDEGKKLGAIGKKKWYVEDKNWGENVKIIYYGMFEYFTPTRVIKNENNLLHVEIESREFMVEGVIDNLIFKGKRINQYRNLIVENLGKEFKMPSEILGWNKEKNVNLIETDKWEKTREGKGIKLEEEKKSHKPEKSTAELKNSLEKYYQKNGIKMMKLSDEDKEFMDIFFDDGSQKSSNDFSERYDKQKFEQVKIFLKSNDKQSLEYSELTSTDISDPELDKQKEVLKKWMEENNIDEITLKERNEVLCKKCNNSGSLSFGGNFIPGDKEPPEIPEGSRVKIAGVDMARFFQKIGKNSITRQELGISQPNNSEKTENQKNRNNFTWAPWLICIGVVMAVSLLWAFLFWWWSGREQK